MKFEYSVDGDGDRVAFKSEWDADDPDYLAEDAAEHYHQHEGCQTDGCWPLTFEVYADGASLGRFSVAAEMGMSFSVITTKEG